MKNLKIAYSTYGSPWMDYPLKTWLHQDLILKALKDTYDVELISLTPITHPNKVKRLIEDNETSLLFPTIKDLDFKFYNGFYEGECDALIIEPNIVRAYTNYETKERISKEESYDKLIRYVEKAILSGKPVIIYDADAFCTTGREIYCENDSTKSGVGAYIYDNYIDRENVYIVSPMADYPHLKETDSIKSRTFFIPFLISEDEFIPLQEITPKSSRSYSSVYVGNNYFRSDLVKAFDTISSYGSMEVYGDQWSSLSHKAPNAHFNKKQNFSLEEIKEVYSESIFGLYGCPAKFEEYKHYTFRVREYMNAGCFIVPYDNHIKESLSIDDISLTSVMNNADNFQKFMESSDEDYRDYIKKQREKALKFYDYKLYVPIYEKLLGLKK